MAYDEPEQSYFPSARVRLIVRLEDYGKPVPLPPKRPPQIRKGVGLTKGSGLSVQYRNGGWVLLGPGDNPSQIGSPQQQQSSSDDLTHVIDGIIPVRAGLRRNGIRTANTLSLSIPFVHLPIDPRCVRAIGVQYFLGCVTAEDYQAGIRGAVRTDGNVGSAGLPLNVVADTWTDPYGRKRTNRRFEGWIDNWDAMFAEGDAPTIDLECTDNTRILLEEDAPTRLTIEPKIRLDKAIANYLANFPQFRGLSVQYMPAVDESKIPTLQSALGKTAYQPHLGPPPAGAGGAAGGGGGSSKLKVWDYLTDVAGMVGHTVRMVDSTIVLQKPRTIYDSRFSSRPDDPFTGRILPSGIKVPHRLFIYGHNLSELKIGRKFTTNVPRNVEIRSYDPAKKRTMVVRFPTKESNKRTTKPIPGDSNEQSWWVISRPSIRDEKTARLVAQATYEAQGRPELSVRFITKNLGSFGGGNLDPDALDALEGDTVEVEVLRKSDGSTIPNTVTDIQEQLRMRPQEFLMSLNYSEKFAKAYAKVVSNIGLPSTFRLKAVGIDWDMESSGVTIDFDAMNYIEIRANTDLPPDEQTNPSGSQTSANSQGPVVVGTTDN